MLDGKNKMMHKNCTNNVAEWFNYDFMISLNHSCKVINFSYWSNSFCMHFHTIKLKIKC